MANKEEEDYLDSLLKSMSNDNNEAEDVSADSEITEDDSLFLNEEHKSEEVFLDDLDSQILSQMLINDSESDDNKELSIDELIKNVQENDFDDEELNTQVQDNITAEDIEIPSSDVPVENGISDEELADILALDEGMSINDIPDTIPLDEGMTTEEISKVEAVTNEYDESQDDPVDNSAKTKRKFSFKNLFKKSSKKKNSTEQNTAKDTPESSNDAAEANVSSGNEPVMLDDNQLLLDAIYEDKDTLADEELDEPPKKKKEKKPKQPKKKKEKKPKPKKVKAAKPQKKDVKIPPSAVFKAVLFAAVVIAGVIFSSKIITYSSAVKDAKNLFNRGSYTASYERIQGMKIKSKDKGFYMKAKVMASLYQAMDSYEAFLAINDNTNAVAALVKGVSRKALLDGEIIKYDVVIPAQTVYARILSTLESYGISEQDALDLNSINNYREFMDRISIYGGVSSDSDH